MNNKIYYQQNILAFADDETQFAKNQSVRFPEKVLPGEMEKFFSEFLSENQSRPGEDRKNCVTLSAHFEQILEFLKRKLYYIEAAGGLICRKEECLFIYRLGKWDLPKGKIDRGENSRGAAIRECEEECGIGGLEIRAQLSSTFHIYKYKDSFALKQTYWYLMHTAFNRPLVPQTEENIEKAEWMNSRQIRETVLANTYPTIKDVLDDAQRKKLIEPIE